MPSRVRNAAGSGNAKRSSSMRRGRWRHPGSRPARPYGQHRRGARFQSLDQAFAVQWIDGVAGEQETPERLRRLDGGGIDGIAEAPGPGPAGRHEGEAVRLGAKAGAAIGAEGMDADLAVEGEAVTSAAGV